MIRINPRFAVLGGLLAAAGCTSMQTQVTSFSGDYSVAMEQFQNREIITNVLLARDRMPLHFSELSQINGSLQAQFQLGTTINWGPGASKNSNTVTPQVQFQSSPTFTTAPLDTQAFAVGMLQPIDASYFVAYWQQRRLPKELLFRLFIDSVRNADGGALPGPNGVLRNTPDAQDRDSYLKFLAYMTTLLNHDVEFQTMTVLTPFGEPFQFDTTPPAAGGAAVYKLTDILSAADESSVHLGKVAGKNMLFRRWDDQLVLCYEPRLIAAPAAAAPDLKPFTDLIDKNIGQLLGNAASPLNSGKFTASFVGGSKGPKNNGSANAGGAQNPGGSSKSGPAGAAVQLASPILPLAAMLPKSDCAQLEYVAPAAGNEDQVARDSRSDIQFRLKSVQDVLLYLGAMIRAQSDDAFKSGDVTFFALTPTAKGASYEGASRIDVSYSDGNTYHVGEGDKDYTSEVLGILTELVNARKLSSDIPTTKQVQVIP